MARVYIKIGDVFCIKVSEAGKKYFQLIAYDLTQLNSDVIRAFRRVYPLDTKPSLAEIVQGEVEFYAHCVAKLGVKMNLWEKVGSIAQIGDTAQILFRDTEDYGTGPGEEPIRVSKNWHVWHINDEDFTHVGKLTGKYRNSYMGLVVNPLGIIELLKGNKYPVNYPDFE